MAISAGLYFNAYAVKDDGSLLAWGQNPYGEVGDGTTDPKISPTLVAGLPAVAAVAGGGYHALAAMADGTVWAWGNNDFGQLGDGSTGRISRRSR